MKRLTAAAAALLVSSVAVQAQSSGGKRPSMDTLHMEVLLERHGFTTGVIDGMQDAAFGKAVRGFQKARGLPETGKIDERTRRAIGPGMRPATTTVTLTQGMLAGPFTPTPEEYADQAKLEGLGYQSPLEKLAEMFHTTPRTLVLLNSPQTQMRPGTQIQVPAVLPSSRQYDSKLPEAYRQTLSMLNVDANQRQIDRVVVDKSDGVLRAFAGERLVAQFPATMGSESDPLPIGDWTIKGVAPNPDWHFNPKILKTVSDSEEDAVVPPGPNNPVGIVWLDLSKEHYGIHGTPEPQNIGKTASNGCIRLTNWDAGRLSLMVKPGTPAIFQQ